jgi:voltage-gated potassium channel
MVVLAIAAVWLATGPEDAGSFAAAVAIWAVFLADYLIRLAFASDRRRFVRGNVPDLIAALPLDLLVTADASGLGRVVWLVRLFRLLRVTALVWRVAEDVRGILRTNNLGYVLLSLLVVVSLGGVAISIVEPEIANIGDGIWWSVVTATTVGYGDISPKTAIGRMVAVLLMAVGITAFGLLTATMATYFLNRPKSANPHVEHVIAQLGRWDELSPDERRQLGRMLRAICDDQPGERS